MQKNSASFLSKKNDLALIISLIRPIFIQDAGSGLLTWLA